MSKENLNLPKTAFSMKANLPQKEPGLIDFWDKINLYQNLRNESKGKEKFILHDGISALFRLSELRLGRRKRFACDPQEALDTSG